MRLEGKEFYDWLYPLDRRHARTKAPVEETCDRPCCARYSLGYLHHLFRIHDALAQRLATMHNLRFYSRLMESIRRIALSGRTLGEVQ